MSDTGDTSRPHRPLTEDPTMPVIGGTAEASTGTVASTRSALRPWPTTLLGRILFSRRLVRGRRSETELEHIQRRATIAAARDFGENAQSLRQGSDPIRVDPPHRGVSRTRLARALVPRTRALSHAIVLSARAIDGVKIAQATATRASEDLEAARESLPPRPSTRIVGNVVWALAIIAFAAIEGSATRTLWDDVIGDTRAGVVFAVFSAVVFAFGVHLFAVWLWQLASDFNRVRAVVGGLLVLMAVSVIGFLFVLGTERDNLLISDRLAEIARTQAAAEQQRNGQSLIAGALGSGGATASGSGLAAALGAGSTPTGGGASASSGAATPSTSAPATASSGTASPSTSAPSTSAPTASSSAPSTSASASAAGPASTSQSSGGLAGAIPGAQQSAGGLGGATPGSAGLATTGTGVTNSFSRGGGSSGGLDDVSYKFVVWLNFVMLFALILFTRLRGVGDPYRDARKHLKRLEQRDDEARTRLQAAEVARQDAQVPIDEAARSLFPLADRYAAEEAELDRLFLDQARRSALLAGHGYIDVETVSEPPDLVDMVTGIIEAQIGVMTPAGTGLGYVPYDHDAVTDSIAGAGDRVDSREPLSSFAGSRSAAEVADMSQVREQRRQARRERREQMMQTALTLRDRVVAGRGAQRQPGAGPSGPVDLWPNDTGASPPTDTDRGRPSDEESLGQAPHDRDHDPTPPGAAPPTGADPDPGGRRSEPDWDRDADEPPPLRTGRFDRAEHGTPLAEGELLIDVVSHPDQWRRDQESAEGRQDG
jgi:hypothetical protein